MLKLFVRYGAALAIIQGLSACGYSPVEEKQPETVKTAEETQHDKLVVAFGDSLYAGYQLGPNEGLAPQLQAALKAKGINAKVHPAGVTGDTTAAGKARLTFVLDNLKAKPDLVVLGLGGNDMLRGIKPEQTRQNLMAMMDELKKRNIRVVLTGMLAAPNLGADYARVFNPIYPELAAKYQVPLMPFFLEGVVMDKNLMLPDAIHPNAKGVKKVVETLSPFVERELTSTKQSVLKK
jgi:acyl-CoA thioesterase I